MKRYITLDMQKIKNLDDMNINLWLLCENIHFLSNNDYHSCYASRKSLASHQGLSERQILRIIENGISNNYITKTDLKHLRITKKWLNLQEVKNVEPVTKCHNVVSPTTTKCHVDDDKMSLETTTKCHTKKETKRDIKKDIKNIKKDFSFSLSKNTQLDNTTQEYQDKLTAYSVTKDGAYNLENFVNHHLAKGSQFKDWSRAYNTWISNSIKFNKFEPKKYITEHYDEKNDKKMFQEYGTNNLYCPKELKFLATFKSQPQVHTEEKIHQSEDINPAVKKLLEKKSA